jgi:hypothetical protein
MYPKGANEDDALLWSKGASKGDAFLSTVTQTVATSTPQGVSESGALLCTKDVRYLGALQSGPYMEYVSRGSICKKNQKIKIKKLHHVRCHFVHGPSKQLCVAH